MPRPRHPPEDQVRAAVRKYRAAFRPSQVEQVAALYAPKERTRTAMKADGDVDLKAAVRFKGDLDLTAVVGELNVTPKALRKLLDRASRLPGAGRAGVRQGIAAADLEAAFSHLLHDLDLGKPAGRVTFASVPLRSSESALGRSPPWAGLARPEVPPPVTGEMREVFWTGSCEGRRRDAEVTPRRPGPCYVPQNVR